MRLPRFGALFVVAVFLVSACAAGTTTVAPTATPLATTGATATPVQPTVTPTPAPTIRIGLSPDNPPMEFADANDPTSYKGFDIDMIKAVMGNLNRQYEIKPFQFSGLIPALQAGQIDVVISDLWVNSDRSKVVDFVSYQIAAQALLVKNGNPLGFQQATDLCGHNAAAKLGSVGQTWLQDQSTACTTASKAAINVSTYPDLPTGLLALNNGRTDAIFEDALSTSYVQTQNPGKYSIAFVTPGNIIVAAAVKKGNTDLAQLLQTGFTWFQSSGQYDSTLKTWNIPTQLRSDVNIITDYPAPSPTS